MAKGKSPAFQFYPSDFLSDENVVLMSNAEVGCYIKLLCFCWKQGSIPADVPRIAKLCNEPPEKMAGMWSSIEPCFRNGQPNRLIHPRLDVERKKQQRFSKERSESGKRGAEKRWKNNQKDGSAIKQPLAKNGFSSSSSTSSLKIKDNSAKKDFYLTYKKRKLTGKRLDTFELFWDAFGYKKGRSAAADSWLDIPELTDALVEKIVTAAKIESRERIKIFNSGGTPKMAQGWLTAERWTDEPYKKPKPETELV